MKVKDKKPNILSLYLINIRFFAGYYDYLPGSRIVTFREVIIVLFCQLNLISRNTISGSVIIPIRVETNTLSVANL
jgi:hypothetical protein